MRFLYFLADHVFRFRYRDPSTERDEENNVLVWDIGIYEDEIDKVHRDFFIMGGVLGFVFAAILGGLLWLTVL